MANIKPFFAVRPQGQYVDKVAALPYDVYNRKEAKEEALKEKLSFLNIDRPETQFPDDMDMYAEEVYQKAKEMYEEQKQQGVYVQEEKKSYYVYRLTMNGRGQTGIVACASVDDYLNNVIKKHENTREEKEQDRIRHVDTLSAQTGPIFLAYRSNEGINAIVEKTVKNEPMYDFVAEDGIGHTVWVISDETEVQAIENAFRNIDQIYIADGHHRAASAVKVGLKRRKEHPDFTGTEEFNYFLSVLFPDDQLMIMDYNRTVKDLNGRSKEAFLEEAGKDFTVSAPSDAVLKPMKKGDFTMYLDGKWYQLSIKPGIVDEKDAVASLDVSVLQDYLLRPILGIEDPRTDDRIDFVGGIRGLEELEKRANSDMKISFAMYPTSIGELFAVADAGLLMPPKSTWFEPKLRSGLFIHEIEK